MLPIPELIRTVVSTTAIEYDGFSYKRMLFCMTDTSTNINPIPSIEKYKRVGSIDDSLKYSNRLRRLLDSLATDVF